MNKNMIHVITLPALLASGVSLHVLSYAMEEPPEIIASSPVPVSSTLAANDSQPANPDETDSEAIPKDEPGKEEPGKAEAVDKVAAKAPETKNPGNKEIKQPVKPVKETPVVREEATTVKAVSEPGIPALLTLLPSKTNRDIIREAKLVGGRMDPFLSIKPPEVPEVPVIPQTDMMASVPQIPNNDDFTFDKPKNNPKSNNNKNQGKSTAPKPPAIMVPSFGDDTSKPANPPANNQAVKPADPQIVWDTVNLEEGVELTGIITGSKPLALITVDGESKVVAIGEFVRKDKKIKLVSINFESQEITVADNRNKSARIEIKE